MDNHPYDFDRVISRDGTHSLKWNYAKEMTGAEDVLPMWVADMDFETVPAVSEAIRERTRHGIYGYTRNSPTYYEAILDWNRRRHGWEAERDWIVQTNGVVNALYTAVRAFTEPGDGVLVQPPVYPPFYKAIQRKGRAVISNPLKPVGGRYELDLEDFEEKLKSGKVKLFLLCNPHNPVGRVFTREELTAMGELCLRHGVTVVSDEIHGDLVYRPNRHIPFAALSPELSAISVVCTAPSKTFNLAGLANSNIFIPDKALRRRFEEAADDTAQRSFNLFGAIASEAAYRQGEAWLEQLLPYLLGNLRFAADFLRERLPGLRVYEPEGTYFLWVDCRSLQLDNRRLERFLLHTAGLWFNQGYTFGSEGDGFIRINLACRRAIVEEAMSRLERAVLSLEADRR
ncbi:MalY/PatB family protein [Gorillibacterium sp. sgz500922]|uniref:MalY/PatB family protein n=1 Tax=Gorillibacterium sp. sgz500922 TaxID=3446694 RepID=UPI003F681704